MSLYRTVFEKKQPILSKIAYFPHPRVFNAPADWVPLGIGYRRKGSKTRIMGVPDGQKVLR